MKNLPKIKIEKNLKQEINIFIKFLNHPYYPQHRNLIFQVFPELKFQLEKSKNKKEMVKKFIIDFYKSHKNIIKKILKESETIIKKNSYKALKSLANLMDYKWSEPITYKAIPTILPFSPFSDNIFYFSILGQIKNRSDKDIICIAIHEISHFIFYDILQKMKLEKIQEDLKNYFKETLTTVLLNQKPLRNILNLRDYQGNPEIRDLYIKKSNEKIMKFTDFLQEYYQNSRMENKSFQIFLQEIINILMPTSKEFSKKRAIWDRYGNQLHKKPSTLHLYQKPIKIKNK